MRTPAFLRPFRGWFRFEAGQTRYAAYEWWVMRAGLAFLAWEATPAGLPYPQQPLPTGIAKFMDLTWMGPGSESWMPPLLIGAAVLFALGILPALSCFTLLFLHVGVATLALSQGGGGGSHHATHIIGAALLAAWLGHVFFYLRTLRERGMSGLLQEWKRHWTWPSWLMKNPAAITRAAAGGMERAAESLRSTVIYTVQQFVACGYVVSGISKLWRSEGRWMSDVLNIPLQFEKNRLNEYHDKLIPPPDAGARMAEWIGMHPALAGGMFGIGLFLELFCFLALWNRRMLAAFGIGLIVMHLMIADLMNLHFYFNRSVLLLFYVNVPFWLILLLKRKSGPPGTIPLAEPVRA